MDKQLDSDILNIFNSLDIKCRFLSAADADEYKQLREKALKGKDRHFLTANSDEEFSRSQEEWRSICVETQTHAIVGAFKNDSLLGVMAVDILQDGRTAYYSSAYLFDEIRHTKVAGVLIRMLDRWARDHGCTKARFTIKPSNSRWLEKQIAHGAKIIGVTKKQFADGSEGDIFILERELNRMESALRKNGLSLPFQPQLI